MTALDDMQPRPGPHAYICRCIVVLQGGKTEEEEIEADMFARLVRQKSWSREYFRRQFGELTAML